MGSEKLISVLNVDALKLKFHFFVFGLIKCKVF